MASRRSSHRGTPPPPERRMSMEELAVEVERNRGIIHQIALRWHGRTNRRLGVDEFVSAVYQGFVNATRLYDKDRGVKFATYASWWADNEVRKMLQFHDPTIGPGRGPLKRGVDPSSRVRVNFILDAIVAPSTFDDPDALGVCIASEPEDCEPPEDFWDRIRSVLTPREYQAIDLRFREDMTYAEIGEVLGVCKERVRQLLCSSRYKIARRCDLGSLTV